MNVLGIYIHNISMYITCTDYLLVNCIGYFLVNYHNVNMITNEYSFVPEFYKFFNIFLNVER